MDNYFEKTINSENDLLYALFVNALMFHSDSKELQKEYIYKTLLRFIGDEYALAVHSGVSPTEAHKALGILFFHAVGRLGNWAHFADYTLTYRKEKLEQEFSDRLGKGIVAGQILHTAIENKVSISTSIKTLLEDNQQNKEIFSANKLQVHGIDLNFTESNLMNNIWPKYKNVSHFWASFLNFSPSESADIKSRVFIDISDLRSSNPKIHAEGVDGFMGLSNKYLKLATSFTPARASKPLLVMEEAYKVYFPWEHDHSSTP